MADDITKMESSLAQIERLIQRLVVLFEGDMKKGLSRINDSAEDAVNAVDESGKITKNIVKNVTEQNRKYKKVDKNVKDTVDAVEEQASSSSKTLAGFDKLAASTRAFAHKFNQYVDGSVKMSSEVRQALNTSSNLFSTAVNNFSRLESSAARAAAESKSMLTAGQMAEKGASYFASYARNITQFGPLVGTILGTLDSVTDILVTQRKQMERRIEIARRMADIGYESEESLRLATNSGLTSGEAKRDTVLQRLRDAEQRKVNLEAAKQALATKNAVDAASSIGASYGFGTSDKVGADSTAEIRSLQERINKDEVDMQSNIELLTKARDAISLESRAATKAAELQQLTIDATKELNAATLASRTKDYEGVKQALQLQLDKLANSNIKGSDVEKVSMQIELRKQLQQNEIDRIQEDYNNKVVALDTNPAYDSKGNVVESAMLEARQVLLDKMVADIAALRESFERRTGLDLTPQQRNQLDLEASKLNDGLDSALVSAQATKLGLNQRTTASAQADAANKIRTAISAIERESAGNLRLLKPGTLYDSVDPMTSLLAQEQALKETISEYNAMKATATGDGLKTLLASLDSSKTALETLVSVDMVLAQRSIAAMAYTAKLEALEREISSTASRSEVGFIKGSQNFERIKRQLATSGIDLGQSAMIDIAAQEADFNRKKALADKLRQTYQAEYDTAVKEGASAETQLELKRKLFDSNVAYKSLLEEQALLAAKQVTTIKYQLNGDKSTFDRFNREIRMASTPPAWMSGFKKTAATDFGAGLGSESARFTGDFNESWRKKYGKLTDEEQAAAKEERRLNNQLERARRAIAKGSGTSKQYELVAAFNNQKSAPDTLVQIAEKHLKEAEYTNDILSVIAGLPKGKK